MIGYFVHLFTYLKLHEHREHFEHGEHCEFLYVVYFIRLMYFVHLFTYLKLHEHRSFLFTYIGKYMNIVHIARSNIRTFIVLLCSSDYMND
jgi:hypothetical protein